MSLDKFSTHIHLYYREPALELLTLLSKVWRGRLIHLSLNNGGEHNEDILKLAEQLFEVKTTFVEDMGNDQWGFINSLRDSEEDTENILYLHDKKDTSWMMRACEPLLEKNCEAFSLMEQLGVGLVGAKSTKQKILSYQEVLDEHHPHAILNKGKGGWDLYRSNGGSNGTQIVQGLTTLCWYQVLIRELSSAYNIVAHGDIFDTFFSAGTIFMAKRHLVQLSHSCTVDSFFESGYMPDGKVEHALERFYSYVCRSINLRSVFI